MKHELGARRKLIGGLLAAAWAAHSGLSAGQGSWRETVDSIVYRLGPGGSGAGSAGRVGDFVAKELAAKGAESAVPVGWARHAVKIGNLFVAFIDNAQAVGRESRGQLVLYSDAAIGGEASLRPGGSFGVALFYDSGDEMRWTSGFSLVLSRVEVDRPPNSSLAGVTPALVPVAQFPLLGAQEAAHSVFTTDFGNAGEFLIVAKGPIRGIPAGEYVLSVPELPGASASLHIRP